MAYNYEYPYTDAQRGNLDWIINTMKDITSNIDELIEQLRTQIFKLDLKDSNVATQNIPQDDYFWSNGYLYKATVAIPYGDLLQEGTNMQHVTVEDILNAINALIAANAANIQGLIDGTIPAGNSNMLGGEVPSYYATAQNISDIIDGTTPVGDSNMLGGQLPSYYATATDLAGRTGALAATNFPDVGLSTWRIVYVDSVNGSDTNDGLSTSAPMATIDHAYETYGGNYMLNIQLAKGGTYSMGGMYAVVSQLEIGTYGTGADPIINCQSIINLISGIYMRIHDCDINYTGTSTTGSLFGVYHNSRLYIYDCDIDCNNNCNGLTASGSNIFAYHVNISDVNTAFHVDDGGMLSAGGTTGTNVTLGYRADGVSMIIAVESATWYTNATYISGGSQISLNRVWQ